ncbi:MAG: peroxiredoxin [Bacteroidota bacterium]|nr:peroxiredoxin [Bacteroidota bacterium]
MKIEIGTQAPGFTLYNSDKKEVSLKEFQGKNVLILFFPLAFSSVCTAELCQMRDDIARYNQSNAEVLAISVDSPHTLAKFKEDQHLNFTLLSDFNKEVSAQYGSLYETFALGMKGVSKRSAFVIDKDGVIRYAEVLENAGEQPNYEAIDACLSSLN